MNGCWSWSADKILCKLIVTEFYGCVYHMYVSYSVSKQRVQCMMPCHPHTLLCMTNPVGRGWVIARWTKADGWEALGEVHSALLRYTYEYMRLEEGVVLLDALKRTVEWDGFVAHSILSRREKNLKFFHSGQNLTLLCYLRFLVYSPCNQKAIF